MAAIVADDTVKPKPEDHPRRAYVTFLAGTGDYVKGVVGLAKGLRKAKSKYPLVVVVLPDVPADHRKILVDQGCIVREIEPVYPPENLTQFAMARYVINYSKLRIWEFVEYNKMIYLDGDVQVFDNIDHLFDLPNGFFYAVMDCFCEKTWSHTPQYKIGYCQQCPYGVQWPDHVGPKPSLYFNAGMFLYEPNLDTCHDLLEILKITPPTPFAEQDLLNMYFEDIYKPISNVYNLALSMLWHHPENVELDKVKVVHYCAAESKPWPLVITIVSATGLKAHDVHLVVSLSGDESNKKQRTPVHKKGSIDPWSGHTFEFTVEEAALLVTHIEFKIEKNTFFCFKKGSLGRKTTDVVGKVDVPVIKLLLLAKDMLATGDMKPKVLSLKVSSSSPKTKENTIAVLEVSFKFGERFTANLAAAAPPESYTPPMPRPLMAYQQNAAPNFPAEPPPAMNTGATVMGYAVNQQTAAPNYPRAPPPAGETVIGFAAVPYPPSMPRPQAAYPHDTVPNYPAAHPYQPPAPAPQYQTAYVPNAIPTYSHGPPAGYGAPAPQPPHPGGNFLGRVGSEVAVHAITSEFNNLGFDWGGFTDGWF